MSKYVESINATTDRNIILTGMNRFRLLIYEAVFLIYLAE